MFEEYETDEFGNEVLLPPTEFGAAMMMNEVGIKMMRQVTFAHRNQLIVVTEGHSCFVEEIRRHEEGCNRTTYHFSIEGNDLVKTVICESNDCDGQYYSEETFEARLDELEAGYVTEEGLKYPKWKKASER